MTKKAVDWDALSLEYETGSDDLTLAVLAERHGVPLGSLVRHGSDRSFLRGSPTWAERRVQYREKALQEARETLRIKLTRRLVDETEQNLDILKRFKAELVERLQGGKLPATSIENSSRAVIEIIKAERLLMGEPEQQAIQHSGTLGYIPLPIFGDELGPDDDGGDVADETDDPPLTG